MGKKDSKLHWWMLGAVVAIVVLALVMGQSVLGGLSFGISIVALISFILNLIHAAQKKHWVWFVLMLLFSLIVWLLYMIFVSKKVFPKP